MANEIIIDAAEGALGRVASFAAKQALLGKKVVIVNCGEVLVLGNLQNNLDKYKQARARGSSSRKGPHFPKSPERIMKRTVRGMLSYSQTRGRNAFKSIMCYNGVPDEYEKNEKVSFARKLKVKAVKLSVLSERL